MKSIFSFDPVQIFQSRSSIFGFYPTSTFNYYLEGVAIDTNIPKFKKVILRKIKELKAILLTHGHADHVGNAAVLAQKFNCPVYAHFSMLRYLSRKPQMNFVFRYYYGQVSPVDAQPVPDRIETENYVLETIPLAGHTPGSVGYFEPTEKWFFVGDAIPLPEKKRDSAISENMSDLIVFLRKIRDMDVSLLFTGHSGAITEINSLISPRLEWLEYYSSKVTELAREGYNSVQIRQILFGREKFYTRFTGGFYSCRNSILSFLTNKRPMELSLEELKDL